MSDRYKTQLLCEPVPLRFGTSGRRGLVAQLTQLEVYTNALGELHYLQGLAPGAGGICRGDEFYFAYDLRPSSTRYVPEQQGRGELAQAIERAIRDAGLRPVNLGALPTPALASYALERHRGSIMVTGSHIPFDRNGYKTYSARGELLKQDEAPIEQRVEQARQFIYNQPYTQSLFDRQGFFKTVHHPLAPERPEGRAAYLRRYQDFFAGQDLRGLRLLAYQHSAVGRDLLVELLESLGAEVVPAGRSDEFVPIDTENIDAAQLGVIQDLVAAAGPVAAVVSTDGDSDRPLILGVEQCRVRFFGGDLVGMVVAEFLGADAVVVPISCNDAVDRGPLAALVEPKTRIGSPFVIAGMEKALARGRRAVCGWEANGGFLTGSDIGRGGRVLRALPTRDAFLPILGTLFAARERNCAVGALFDQLPRRFSRAALLRNFPRSASQQMLQRFSPENPAALEVAVARRGPLAKDAEGREVAGVKGLAALIRGLEACFTPEAGFGRIVGLNYTDGIRVYFDNGDVAHVRPSGNADELRIYAVADSQGRADQIAELGVAEPDGLLRTLERA